MASGDVDRVRCDLGFVEKTDDSWLLNSNFFPSKVGGKPAWLDLSELPVNSDLKCGKCSQILTFLCQIYAPDESNENCFHRTIYLFVCRDESCCTRNESKNFVVFRSQLKRDNQFYSFEPTNENLKPEWDIENHVKICNLCGIFADKHCGKCKIVSYCCREHQIIDWKAGHKKICGQHRPTYPVKNKFLFDEFEIVIEHEVPQENDETEEEAEFRRRQEFQELETKGELGTMQDCPDLNEVSAIEEDETFSKFREKIAENPEQILRYQKGAEPLWISSEPKPTIPNCENCGSKRQFEFQILPQLLYHLHENCLDWGILCVYTCENNCTSGKIYKKEFVFKQDVALTNI